MEKSFFGMLCDRFVRFCWIASISSRFIPFVAFFSLGNLNIVGWGQIWRVRWTVDNNNGCFSQKSCYQYRETCWSIVMQQKPIVCLVRTRAYAFQKTVEDTLVKYRINFLSGRNELTVNR
ncbi:Hypothetical protein CINCED_3A014881 [Cinara cedri]|uniref:Uncharacterized protein n=1 Tax=Cinara cedri TaxID=506608 RepID=A0A5E4NKZ7_9HEMI|nr:Hypothetical protein CINCED_3A014881 [Cinara cedri]